MREGGKRVREVGRKSKEKIEKREGRERGSETGVYGKREDLRREEGRRTERGI